MRESVGSRSPAAVHGRAALATLLALIGLFATTAAAAGDSAGQNPQTSLLTVPADPMPLPERWHSADVPVAPAETLHVTVAGAGRPVVIVPGLFGGAYAFRKLVTPLADAGFRSIIVEPLGVTRSARPPDADYSLEAQAVRLATALDTVGVDSALVVAHSIGASVAYRLALARPDLVDGIVSIEGGIAERAGSDDLRRALRLAGLASRIGLGGMVEGRLRDRLEAASADATWITDSVLTAYLAPYDDPGDVIAAYRAIADAEPTVALEPRVARLRQPIELLLGGGAHEGGVPDDQLAIMRARLPELDVTFVEGAGVMIHEERPTAVVAAVLRLGRRVRALADRRAP